MTSLVDNFRMVLPTLVLALFVRTAQILACLSAKLIDESLFDYRLNIVGRNAITQRGKASLLRGVSTFHWPLSHGWL